jgi:steroid delta-isomerase-like uncharacterized protein
MGEARELMDRLTEAATGGDVDALAEIYADDARLVTPDQGELEGRAAVVAYMSQFVQAFPDGKFEPLNKLEVGNTAIDEGWFVGTHTGPLETPDGETIPATGKAVRVRSCDLATVENGRITSHRFYFDQLEFLGQLGLAPES